MKTEHLDKFVNAIACDLEEGGFRQVSGTMLRRTLATAVSAALPLLQSQAGTPSALPSTPQWRREMSDTKISEAAVEAASTSMEATKNSIEMTPLDRIGLMLAAALPHLHPQPAELAEPSGNSGELAEQQGVEKRIVTNRPEGMSSDYVYGWNDCMNALAATGKQQVGEIESADDEWHLRGYAYASKQATTCASCGKHKHTPLRIDAMGGYVCLTCIDQKLSALLNEFGYQGEQVGEVQGDALITDAMVDAACKVMYHGYEHESRKAYREACQKDARQALRAALAARQPGVVE